MKWLTAFQLLRRSFFPNSFPPPRLGPAVKTSIRLEEQIVPGYHPDRFFPVQLWKTYHGRYHVITKLGFGTTSTVWLARDTSTPWGMPPCYVALKIFVHDIAPDTVYDEYAVSRRIAGADPSHPGADYACLASDVFEIDGPHGQHTCLVYEPMGETLATTERRLFVRLPSDAVKEILKALLRALDYLHTRCGVVHTDLRKGNIYFSISPMYMIEDLALQEAEDPFPRILDSEYTVYIPRTFQGPAIGPLKLGGFGDAVVHDECPRNYSIQPDAFRAPEVLLGIPWTYSVDIWNLGVLAWELFEVEPLFRGLDHKKQCYTPEFHLAEMMALLGRPPNNLLSRGSNTPAYFALTGAFGGMAPERHTLESRMHNTPSEDREGFASFLRKMLQWQPEDRLSAADLLDDPWVQSGCHFD